MTIKQALAAFEEAYQSLVMIAKTRAITPFDVELQAADKALEDLKQAK